MLRVQTSNLGSRGGAIDEQFRVADNVDERDVPDSYLPSAGAQWTSDPSSMKEYEPERVSFLLRYFGR